MSLVTKRLGVDLKRQNLGGVQTLVLLLSHVRKLAENLLSKGGEQSVDCGICEFFLFTYISNWVENKWDKWAGILESI